MSLPNINILIDTYNRNIAKLLNVCDKLAPGNVDIERVRNSISLVKHTDPLYLLEKSKDKFWDVRDMIKQKNLDYFSNKNNPILKKYIDADKSDQEFIYTLMDLIYENLKKISTKEMEYIWKIIQSMLECNIQYMIYIEDKK